MREKGSCEVGANICQSSRSDVCITEIPRPPRRLVLLHERPLKVNQVRLKMKSSTCGTRCWNSSQVARVVQHSKNACMKRWCVRWHCRATLHWTFSPRVITEPGVQGWMWSGEIIFTVCVLLKTQICDLLMSHKVMVGDPGFSGRRGRWSAVFDTNVDLVLCAVSARKMVGDVVYPFGAKALESIISDLGCAILVGLTSWTVRCGNSSWKVRCRNVS